MKGKFREEGAVEGRQLEETTAAMQGGRGDGEGLHMQKGKYNPHLHIKGENLAMEGEEERSGEERQALCQAVHVMQQVAGLEQARRHQEYPETGIFRLRPLSYISHTQQGSQGSPLHLKDLTFLLKGTTACMNWASTLKSNKRCSKTNP